MENKKKAIYTFIGIILAIALTSLGMKYLGSKHLDGTRLITDSIPTPLQQHIAKDTLRHDSVKPHVDSTYYINGRYAPFKAPESTIFLAISWVPLFLRSYP